MEAKSQMDSLVVDDEDSQHKRLRWIEILEKRLAELSSDTPLFVAVADNYPLAALSVPPDRNGAMYMTFAPDRVSTWSHNDAWLWAEKWNNDCESKFSAQVMPATAFFANKLNSLRSQDKPEDAFTASSVTPVLKM
jgi:hypothetical protein